MKNLLVSQTRFIALLTSLLIIFSCPLLAEQQERITRFVSDIHIFEDGVIDVTEQISVYAKGKQIKRGIFREFPTLYRDQLGHNIQVSFNLKSVTRNGKAEPHFLRQLKNGLRIYIGDKDQLLPEGIHHYQIRYQTNRQLGFFEDYDELYWNATSNGWAFTIEQAQVTVHLPKAVEPIASKAYTGVVGATGDDYKVSYPKVGQVQFDSTKALAPNQGLTVAVSFAKGLVTPLSTTQKINYFFEDNKSILISLLVTIACYLFYFYAWRKVGIDPEPGVIIPEYVPAKGYSPAAMRYIKKMGYDTKAFSSALVNLARKGYLTIEQNDEDYFLVKTSEQQQPLPMASGEQALFEVLFESEQKIELSQDNQSLLHKAKSAHYDALKKDYHTKYFANNSHYLVLPVLATFGLWIYLVQSNNVFNGAQLLLLVLLIFSHLLFLWLLKAPTKLGRKALDKFEGLQLYLATAEAEDLKAKYPLHKTPEVFESFLPFAMALDVEQAWADKFTEAFEQLNAQGVNTQPHWYRGQHWHASNLSAFTQDVGSSFNQAVASASTVPGSSSGTSSGGFSGGGGGGGGGGGW